jgi:hypothetical protein
MPHALSLARPSSQRAQSACDRALDLLFVELLDAYRPSGGLARYTEVTMRMTRRRSDGVTWLESCLRHRRLVAIDWHSELWLPLFQFAAPDMSLREDAHRLCAELNGVMDGWDLAAWFIQPQCLLQYRSPLELLGTQPGSVLDAARQEHFVRGV